jgi:transcriptional regulator with XRE-family HTH domain
MSKETTKFGKLCRSYRAKKGMNMTQTSKMLGISQSTLSNYETGQETPSLKFIKRSMEVYGIKTRKEQMEFLIAALNSFKKIEVPLDHLGVFRKEWLAALFTFGEVEKNNPEGWDELIQWFDDFGAKVKKAKPNFVELGQADPL